MCCWQVMEGISSQPADFFFLFASAARRSGERPVPSQETQHAPKAGEGVTGCDSPWWRGDGHSECYCNELPSQEAFVVPSCTLSPLLQTRNLCIFIDKRLRLLIKTNVLLRKLCQQHSHLLALAACCRVIIRCASSVWLWRRCAKTKQLPWTIAGRNNAVLFAQVRQFNHSLANRRRGSPGRGRRFQCLGYFMAVGLDGGQRAGLFIIFKCACGVEPA